MNIHILGAHSNESKTTKCISFLIDNTLAIDAGAITSSLSLKEQEKIQHILVTHEHFDHIKDIPLFALNAFRMNKSFDVYALQSVISTVKKHLLNGQVYPSFQKIPAEKPTIKFHRIVPFHEQHIQKYKILAVPVNHDGNAVGYQISDNKGKVFFYTADTGPGLLDCWERISCQLLIIETSLPNIDKEYAIKTGHLTPELLLNELKVLKRIKKVLPRIVVVHNDPLYKAEIKEEIEKVAASLKTPITIAAEGNRFIL